MTHSKHKTTAQEIDLIRFDGEVLRPSDSGYEAARCNAVWNGLKPKRYPAVIVVARSHEDVQRAVHLAKKEGLKIGVRSGGHNWVGNAVRDGGMLLDLYNLTSIKVDPVACTAIFDTGVKNHQLIRALAPHGLFFPCGHCSTVGIGGFLLGGGFGFNAAQLGPSTYMVRALDLVTAEGEALHVTDESHPDLMWAARGAGLGFFAVVTRFHVELQPKVPVFAMSTQARPFAHFDDLVGWHTQHWRSLASAGVTTVLIALRVQTPMGEQTVLNLVGYACGNTLDEAAARLAPLATVPGLDGALEYVPPKEVTMSGIHALFDGIYPEGPRYLGDNVYLRLDDSPEQRATIKEIFGNLPTVGCSAWLIPNNAPRDHKNAALKVFDNLGFQAYASYTDPSQDEAMLSWHTGAMKKMEPFSNGAGYVGDSNLFVNPVAILRPEAAQRLEALRSVYDPEGRFHSYPKPLPLARI